MIRLVLCTLLAISTLAPSAVCAGDAKTTGNADSGAAVWGANYFPDVELTTHEGEKVRFFSDLVDGKVVVINFIYTTCPDACPLETARLSEVADILGDRVGRDVHMYSITIDPDRDTPEVLAEYRERYQARDGWVFLTGNEKDIVLLRKKLGLYIADLDQESGDHNLSLIIGNQSTGRWQKSSPFENPYILATQIGQWLTNFSLKTESQGSYDEAPELRSIGDGEKLFRTRCQACHTIGKTTEEDLKPRVGPDLLGVTERRDREWLERWIREPDVMLEEGDSIAQGLFLAYNQVPMPNMRLSAKEVAQVLHYIETEEKRVAKHTQLMAALPEKSEEEGESCCEKALTNVFDRDEPEPTGGGCCDEELAIECEETGESECLCEERTTDFASTGGTGGMPKSLWSGLGVALGAIALALRRGGA